LPFKFIKIVTNEWLFTWTGKQLFEHDSSLFTSDLQLLNEEAIEVDETLFQNLDDLDLDDDGEEYNPEDDYEDDDEEEEEE